MQYFCEPQLWVNSNIGKAHLGIWCAFRESLKAKENCMISSEKKWDQLFLNADSEVLKENGLKKEA